MVNGIVSLISLYVFTVLVYRNARYFCVLILYPETFLYLLINSSNFLVVSLGFSMYRIMSSANTESFISSFPIWIPFISFSSLITMDKSSKSILYSSAKSGHPCLVPDFRGNAFNFSSLRIMFAVGLSYGFYYFEVCSFCICFLDGFYHKWMLNFVKGFLCIY